MRSDQHPDEGSPERPSSERPYLEHPYLELLAQDAPAAAYEEPLLGARTAGAPAEQLAELGRARRAALRVRAELEGRRRREAELTALFETAHDLAGLRDVDAVLRAIVQRARSLLGTEVAYLTLTDPDRGDTYMRVTEGSVSARFQQLRLGMGEGLGGLVAQTARPYVTDDYLQDSRFRHTGTIDTGVTEEGLVAILGVPLLLGREVIGVLYAADRRARFFEREQVALLGSFAAHAAVAIDTARLLAETRGALAGLEAANAIIRDRSRVIERAGEVHDRLAELVLRGGGVTDVAAALAEVLGAAVEFTGVGTASPAAVERSGQEGRAVRDGDTWVAAVAAGGELLGALLLHGLPELDPVDQRTLERAAMVTSLLLLARRSAGEAEQRVRGELLDDLLDAPGRDPRLLRERAARLGADLDVPHVLLAARQDGAGDEVVGRQLLGSAAAHLAATWQGLAAARDGGVVLLMPLGSTGAPAPGGGTGHPAGAGGAGTPGSLARWAAAQLTGSLSAPVTVGASAVMPAPAAAPATVADAYAEARRCVQALRLLGRGGEGGAAEEFGFLGLLLADSQDVAGFVRRTLGPLLDYDARRGTELVVTVDAFFACGMSPARAKDVLHIHVNTVAQRLDRVGRLLGEDWQSPSRALEIQLALRLHRLSAAVVR
ncbi:GAF domain-containing protein [Streptomyces sp. ACA25]|uniref:helix-turn-helix domain-containing protein n=1 Tax=Streptomyces sp. ACA25 TaxID=3022596 RepID=UPI002307557F|nr:GAF domain-containing protein [Streptomyces sp. ACA25]MDB1088005.1 GAF domain-containing protein [Streptomyces sp. ACA25]